MLDVREIGEMNSGFWWENQRERGHLEDPGVDGRIILKYIFGKRNGGMDWTVMVQDSDR